MADPFAGRKVSLSDPISNAASVTPSDTADLATQARALWVGGSGDVKVDTAGGDTVTFSGVSGLLPVRVARVYSTGTTGTNIMALW